MREAVKKYIAEHYEDYVKDLEALTNIDSGNGDREGTEAANKFVAEKMTAIGATTEFRYNDRACHLISRLKGTGKYTILLVAHVDTVFKKGEAARRPFRVDENNFAWGPGVGDDKATVVEVIYGLEALKAAGFDNFKEIIYYTNGEEEGGSKTAEDIVAELSQQSDFAIIMDVARPNWGIVTQRKGNAKYRVEVTGKGGHHGNASQSCANAIHQLAYTITELQKLASPMPVNPEDYTARSNLMWLSTMAENRIIKLGKKCDFECHQMEHQISAYTNCSHGCGLAVLHPVYYRHICQAGAKKFTRFAENVWKISRNGRTDEEMAEAGVEALANFIREIGLPTTLREVGVEKKEDLKEIADSCYLVDGSYKKMTHEEILEIFLECF